LFVDRGLEDLAIGAIGEGVEATPGRSNFHALDVPWAVASTAIGIVHEGGCEEIVPDAKGDLDTSILLKESSLR